MTDPIIWIVLGFLLIVSIIDFKVKAIPSIFLTGMIFVVAFVNPANLWFGLMGLIMACLLYEAGFFSGMADIKIMTLIAFLLSTTNQFFLYVFLVLLFGIVWKALWNWRFKLKNKELPDEFPFVPVFLFVYATLLYIKIQLGVWA